MHLTGPKGNREAEGKQHSLVPVGTVMKCFVVLPNSKVKTKKPAKELFAWRQLAQRICRGFKRTRPDHVRGESSSCCFAKELVSFVSTREFVSFNQRHETLRSENAFELEGIAI